VDLKPDNGSSRWKVFNIHASCNLSLVPKTGANADNIFKITIDNVDEVTRIFKVALNWFYDKEYDQLFMYNQNNEIQLNSKFIELRSVSKLNTVPIIIAPSIVPTEDNSSYIYGVAVCSMIKSNILLMNLKDLNSICAVLSRISFSEEALLLISMVNLYKGE